jgi:glucans biosynthesis protein
MSPAVSGKKRCRMHGGAAGSGAPRGNKNAIKHGHFTREAIERRRQVQQLIRQSGKLVLDIE